MKRKKLSLSLLLCVAFVFSFMPLTACAASIWDGSSTAPTQGSGTSGDPYKIGTAEELAWFAGQVNGGDTGICAVLTANIKLNDSDKWADWATAPPANAWTPIGNSSTNQFTGSFDGNGHTVSGIYISSGNCVGLFGRAGTGGNIRNVRVTESYIASSPDTYGYSKAAGVCGRNNGSSISGCYNYGTVVGTGNFVGGICGENIGTVIGCYNHGSVQGVQSVGGVCGINVGGGTVEGCGNTGSVTGTKFVGGVCGSLSAATEPKATILDCFNTGTVQGSNSGSICGYNLQGSISGCYFLNYTGAVGVGGNDSGTIDAAGPARLPSKRKTPSVSIRRN